MHILALMSDIASYPSNVKHVQLRATGLIQGLGLVKAIQLIIMDIASAVHNLGCLCINVVVKNYDDEIQNKQILLRVTPLCMLISIQIYGAAWRDRNSRN